MSVAIPLWGMAVGMAAVSAALGVMAMHVGRGTGIAVWLTAGALACIAAAFALQVMSERRGESD